MADISLDDLITKDRQKAKDARKNKVTAKKVPPQLYQTDGPRRKKDGSGNQASNSNKGKNSQPKPRREERERDRSPQDRNDNEPRDDGRRLRIMGLHPDITSQELFKLFTQQGALEICRIDQDNFGRSQTTAIVVYHNIQNAQAAVNALNQHKIMNSVITVEFAKRKSFAPKTKKISKQTFEARGDRNQNNRQPNKKPFKANRGKKFSK